MSDPVILTIDAGIAEIRFNRPDRLNALDVELAEAFLDRVRTATGDPQVRVIVISAEGRSFMAGGDLRHLRGADDRTKAAAQLIDPTHAALKALNEAPQIVIGSVQGALAGGGMSLAIGLDLLVAAENATFNLAYARIGTSPDCSGSWALPRLVGFRRALEIALLSETIDAREAHRIGLVNRVVPAAELAQATRALATRLAEGAPAAQAEIKRLMRSSLDRDFADQLDAEAAAFGACVATADFAEGVDAFFGRRKPVFRGA